MFFQDRKGKFVKKPDDKPLEKRIGVYGLFIKSDTVLLVKPSVGIRWFIPGGGLESGETLEDGLKREFLEETGFEIENHQKIEFPPIKSRFYADDLDQYFQTENHFFKILEARKNNENCVLDREIKELMWISLSRITEYQIYPDHMKIINIGTDHKFE